MTTPYHQGQTIIIKRTGRFAENSIARFERVGSTGMVYATREDGSDAVAFADEVSVALGCDVQIKAKGEEVKVARRSNPSFFVDYANRNANGNSAKPNRRKPRPGRDWYHLPGVSLTEVAKMAGCTPNVVQKAFRSGDISATRHGHRTVRVDHGEATRWSSIFRQKQHSILPVKSHENDDQSTGKRHDINPH
jgi:hypothetical protein